MGLIANEKLGTDPFLKNAKVMTGSTPPISCIVDGIPLSSGCTLGKGNIQVFDENIAKAIFTDKSGNELLIKLKDELRQEIDTTVTKENIESYSKSLYEKTDSELFEVNL